MSISMTTDFVVRLFKTISVLVIALSCFLSRWLTTDTHAFNAPFSRAYWGTNSETLTVERFSQMFLPAISTATFLFAKDASIIMREALTGVCQADCSPAVLSARSRPGYEGDAHRATRAERHAHWLSYGLLFEFRACSILGMNSAHTLNCAK